MIEEFPIPNNELERLLALSNLDLDYYDSKHGIEWLTEMAAKVAGTKISLVNLIDSYTQWSISSVGIDVSQMAREDSVCQYTLDTEEGEFFEVDNLTLDDRFKEKFYVKDDPNLTYYFGVPLKTNEGYNLGSLCVMDVEMKHINSEKRELLRMIARQIVDRLNLNSRVHDLKLNMSEVQQSQKKLVHDIRGPISGIVGLAEIIKNQGKENKLDEVLEYMELIQNSGNSILDLADEILTHHFENSNGGTRTLKDNEYNLHLFQSKILNMFAPQALVKGVEFKVCLGQENLLVPFPKTKLMQIIGNLISNSIKFTPEGGAITVHLKMHKEAESEVLEMTVRDSGKGMSQSKIDQILTEGATSEKGTSGEKGFGFGLMVVVKLIREMKGEIAINSVEGVGTEFKINLTLN